MTISRVWLFIVLFTVIVCLFFLPRLIWFSNSVAATGTKYFTGHGNLGSVLGLSTYPVIQYTVGNDTLDFNGNVNIPLEDGQQVAIRYQRDNPSDACIDTFKGMRADVLIFSIGPFMIYFALMFTPELIPRSIRLWPKRKRGVPAT